MTKRAAPKRTQIAVWIPATIKARLDAIKDRDGVPLTRQLERALELYLRQAEAAR